jgi:uncharacterized protein (DUF362 family)/Pyruvate/2-oxoacid:ferredoxin oxidoreductase delta subunit
MSCRVITVHCSDYAAVAIAVALLIDRLGGMSAFVRPGQSVLIKPNMLTDARPDEAVTTHPEVVRAVIRIVKAAGGVPWVADSPANVADLGKVWVATGMEALCREEGIPLVNLEQAGSETIEEEGICFTIAKPVLEADLIISVPKVKTHVLTGLTGAVKNMYGVVPGFQKTALHKQYPRAREFGEMLAAVYGRARPVLAIADGVVAMDGDGPSAGAPYPLGVLAASADPVALDAVLCRMMGMDPASVEHLAVAARRGLGVCDLRRIEIEGDGISVKPSRACRLPKTVPTSLIPKWLVKMIQPFVWHRPSFNERCISCGQCVKACPVNAISLRPKERPELELAKCIACCCCHEICPVHAITMEPSPLFKLVQAIRPKREKGT